jgi:hypothetical protein
VPARRAGSVRRHRLLARASQLSPGSVEVTLGTLGAGAQLATSLLEHLCAGFQRGAQFLALTRGVFSGPRGFCACVLGACVGGRSALVGLRGLRKRLVLGVVRGADLRLGFGPCTPDRFLRLRLGAPHALISLGPRGGLVRFGALHCGVTLCVSLADGFVALGADPLEFGSVRGGGLGQAVVSFTCPGFRCFCELPGGLRLGVRLAACILWLTGRSLPRTSSRTRCAAE